jgi:hypothetical protein
MYTFAAGSTVRYTFTAALTVMYTFTAGSTESLLKLRIEISTLDNKEEFLSLELYRTISSLGIMHGTR